MSPTRRGFVAGTGAALATVACAPFLHLVGRHDHDVVIRGGTVFDGTGAEGREADVAMRGGVITAIAPAIAGSARVEIDARGKAVAPGFVDPHSHGDSSLFDDPRAESVIRQGITTVVVGQDGSSRAPAPRPTSAAGLVRGALGTNGRFESMHELFRALNNLPSAVNVASMVGLGTVRQLVVGEDDAGAGDEVAPGRAHFDSSAAGSAAGDVERASSL